MRHVFDLKVPVTYLELLNAERARWRGTYGTHPPADSFAVNRLVDFVPGLSEICRRIVENVQFPVEKEILEKRVFQPATTNLRLCNPECSVTDRPPWVGWRRVRGSAFDPLELVESVRVLTPSKCPRGLASTPRWI